jgi:hypothetical protein
LQHPCPHGIPKDRQMIQAFVLRLIQINYEFAGRR